MRVDSKQAALPGAFRYTRNTAVPQQDRELMPERNSVRSRWNDLGCAGYDGVFGHCVTYWWNRLQDLDERVPPFVTLGSSRPPWPKACRRPLNTIILATVASLHMPSAGHGSGRPPATAGIAAVTSAPAFMRYPLMTLKVMVGIHWEAFQLWRKGLHLADRPQPLCEAVTNVTSPEPHRSGA
ncbi:MAG: DUF1365 family protein [Hyphomicrobium sp.]